MSKLVISDLPDSTYKGKRVFVRVDFNVPIRDGKISEDYRIRRVIPTIDYLVERGAKVILGSHLGRPKGIVMPELSLKPIADRLSELLGKSVKFTGKVTGPEVKESIDSLADGEVMLLDEILTGEDCRAGAVRGRRALKLGQRLVDHRGVEDLVEREFVLKLSVGVVD